MSFPYIHSGSPWKPADGEIITGQNASREGREKTARGREEKKGTRGTEMERARAAGAYGKNEGRTGTGTKEKSRRDVVSGDKVPSGEYLGGMAT